MVIYAQVHGFFLLSFHKADKKTLSTKNIKKILCLRVTFPLHQFVLNLTSDSAFNFLASYFTLREYFYDIKNMA